MKRINLHLLIAALMGLLSWLVSKKLLIDYLPPAPNSCPGTVLCSYADYRPTVYSIIIGIIVALLSFVIMRIIYKKK